VISNKSTEIKLIIFEGEKNFKYQEIPLFVNVASYFSKYTINPLKNINFGSLQFNEVNTRSIEIINEVKQNLKNDFMKCNEDESMKERFDEVKESNSHDKEKHKKDKEAYVKSECFDKFYKNNIEAKGVIKQFNNLISNTPKGSSKILPKPSIGMVKTNNILTNKTLCSNFYNNNINIANTPSQNRYINENKENIQVNINSNLNLKPIPPIPNISSLKSNNISSEKDIRNVRTPNILQSKVNLIKTLTANSVSSSKNSSRQETKNNEHAQSSVSNYQIKIKVPIQTSIKVNNQKIACRLKSCTLFICLFFVTFGFWDTR
jgi:hypothetical protein